MSPTLTVFAISASGLFVLVLLFRIEDRRGSRLILGGLRGLADSGLVRVGLAYRGVSEYLGGSFLRQIFHFIIHRFLRAMLLIVRGLEFLLRKLQRTNRQVAESIVAADSDTHLGQVRNHADTIKLHGEERRQKRREMLE